MNVIFLLLFSVFALFSNAKQNIKLGAGFGFAKYKKSERNKNFSAIYHNTTSDGTLYGTLLVSAQESQTIFDQIIIDGYNKALKETFEDLYVFGGLHLDIDFVYNFLVREHSNIRHELGICLFVSADWQKLAMNVEDKTKIDVSYSFPEIYIGPQYTLQKNKFVCMLGLFLVVSKQSVHMKVSDNFNFPETKNDTVSAQEYKRTITELKQNNTKFTTNFSLHGSLMIGFGFKIKSDFYIYFKFQFIPSYSITFDEKGFACDIATCYSDQTSMIGDKESKLLCVTDKRLHLPFSGKASVIFAWSVDF